MPHQCTSCGRTFADGSKEMLSGCPDCGGNKFQFKPPGATESDAGPGTDGPEATSGGPEATSGGSNATSGGSNATSGGPNAAAPDETEGRDDFGSDGPRSRSESSRTPPSESAPASTSTDGTDRPASDVETDTGAAPEVDAPEADAPEVDAPEVDAEDRAQASARSDVVSPDELPDHDGGDARPEPGASEDEAPPADERPGLDSLREELNDQFESIRIVSQGEYELNLMELYDRQEYIISLREDGRYVIEMPGDWGPDDE